MNNLLVVFLIIVLLVTSALAEVNTIALNNKNLLEIESLLKSKGYNVKVLKGTKALVKHKDITSQLIILIYNFDTQKNGVYFLNYKDDNLITILKEER